VAFDGGTQFVDDGSLALSLGFQLLDLGKSPVALKSE